MAKRKELKDLTITDDFMFGAVMRNPKRCKPLLEMILKKKIKDIKYPEIQKTIDERYDSKGIRLDVYVEDDEQTVYNVEIQTTSSRFLPKRIRYYRGMIDINILGKGESYKKLKQSFVIFICTYDPYGKKRYVYTFENRCLEDFEISLGEDVQIIVLNTKGEVGDISNDLKELLHYMDGKLPQSEYTKEIDADVEAVKADEDRRREYMMMVERDRNNIELGDYKRMVRIVRSNRTKRTVDELADLLEETMKTITLIVAKIDEHPDWDDEEVAEDVIEETE